MRIGIVGASGEIGGYVCRYLAKQGFEAVPVVRRSAGPLLGRWDMEPVLVDLSNEESANDGLKGCNVVVNCMIDKGNYHTIRERVARNTRYCINLLKSAVRNRASRVIHLSSIVVLPPKVTDAGLLSETAYSKEQDWYTRAKIGTERLFLKHHSSTTSVVVIRPGIVYGPYMRWSRVAFERLTDNRVVLPDVPNWCYAVHPIDIARLIERLIVSDSACQMLYAINPEQISWDQFYSLHGKFLGMEDRVSTKPVEDLVRIVDALQVPYRDGVLKWAYESPLLDIVRDSSVATKVVQWMSKRFMRRVDGSTTSNDFLYPSKFELEMYQSSGRTEIVETGQGIGFEYKVPFEVGCKNAAWWWKNRFVT
jgi:nucleoside-diphosphate-sugar epimerase